MCYCWLDIRQWLALFDRSPFVLPSIFLGESLTGSAFKHCTILNGGYWNGEVETSLGDERSEVAEGLAAGTSNNRPGPFKILHTNVLPSRSTAQP